MEHTKLLKDARKLANALQLTRRPHTIGADARTIYTLADLVERLERRENTIRTVLKECDAFNAELVAACAECDEAIVRVISLHQPTRAPDGSLPTSWAGLQNARRRAQRAVKLADTQRHVDETMAVATAKYDALLRRLGGTTNSTYPSNDQLLEWARTGNPPQEFWDANDDPFKAEPAPMSNEKIEQIADHATTRPLGVTDMPDRTEPSAPPVEVEMQVMGLDRDQCAWECRLADRTGASSTAVYESTEGAMMGGNAWLAALGEQFGVNLVPVWKDEPQAKANTAVCQRCRANFDPTTTGLVAPMWPGLCGPCNHKEADEFARRG